MTIALTWWILNREMGPGLIDARTILEVVHDS